MTKELLYKNEKSLFIIAAIISCIFWAIVVLGTFGVALIYGLMFFLFYLFAHSALISYLKGTAVKVTPEQFPDIYEQLQYCCNKLNISDVPETYILHAEGAFNAFATRFLGRNFVVLFSDVVDALSANKNSVNFYIGHELGHIHRKHLIWSPVLFPALFLPLLGAAYSRSREYTCDNYGFACCPEPKDAVYGLAALAAGAQRWKTIKIPSYIAQTDNTGSFWMSFNELIADYPWLVKRMSRLVALAKNQPVTMPKRNIFAWILAIFIPRIGMGAGAGSIVIIIAIVAILAAIAIPQFTAFQQRAKQLTSPSINQFVEPDSKIDIQ